MKSNKFKRILSALLVTSLITGQVAFANNLHTEYKHEIQIGQGTTYSDISTVSSAGEQNIRVIEYSPNANITPMIGYGDKIVSRDTIIEYAKDIEGTGKQVIAGINGDYYSTDTGVPVGLVINEGVLTSSDAWQSAVGFKADGSAVIGKPTFGMLLSNGVDYVTVDYFNKTRTTSGIYLLDHNYYNETRLSASGKNILFERVDDTPVTVGGTVNLKVVSVYETNQSQPIAENQMVLCVSNSGPIERFPEFNVGDNVTLTVSTNNPEWTEVIYAIGGKEVLVENGNANNHGTTEQPRTAVGVKADGSVVLVEVDGRGKGNSDGIGLLDLALYMKSIGCVTAINLDGGGSSVMVAQLPGDSLLTTLNLPSDGVLRKSANFIYLVNNTMPSNQIDKLHIYPNTYTMLPHASVNLTVKATDANFNSVTPPQDVTYDVENGSATITENGVLTADKTGVITVSASANGVTGTEQITVMEKVEKISMLTDETDKAITSLSLGTGKSYDLSATASYRDKYVASVDKSYTWSVQGNIGTIDENGLFTAGSVPADGSITVNYGSAKDTISVSVGLSEQTDVNIIEGFEDEVLEFTVNGGTLSTSNDLSNVLYGMSNGVISYENTDKINLTNKEIYIAPEYKTFGIYVKSDNIASITANFTDVNAVPLQLELVQGNENDGYIYYSAVLPEYAVNFKGFDITLEEQTTGQIQIDNISALLTESYDDIAPLLTTTQTSVNIDNGQSYTANFKVTDENGAVFIENENLNVYLDGEKITNYSYDTKTGNLSVKVTVAPLPIVPEEGEQVITDTASAEHRNTVQDPETVVTDPEQPTEPADTTEPTDTTEPPVVVNPEPVEPEPVEPTPTPDPVPTEPIPQPVQQIEFPTSSQGALSDGIHRITVTAYDNSGNISTESLEIKAGQSNYKAFADTASHWSEGYVNFVAEQGIITGSVSDGQYYFNPSRNLTRAEFAVIMARYLQLEVPTEMTLDVIDADKIPSWALDSVKAVYANGIMTGSLNTATGEMMFNPTNNITRAEVMTVIGKTIEKGYEISELTATDSGNVPSWSYPYVETLVSLGYIGGYPDGTILPMNNITRGEIAKILYTLH